MFPAWEPRPLLGTDHRLKNLEDEICLEEEEFELTPEAVIRPHHFHLTLYLALVLVIVVSLWILSELARTRISSSCAVQRGKLN
jgi:hypothetical protein